MYKVFVQQKEIRLMPSSKLKTTSKVTEVYSEKLPSWPTLKKMVVAIDGDMLKIYCEHPKRCWSNFKKRFRILKAAGGLVVNPKNELLMIKRFGLWDLPKGKIEKGEDIVDCAIREVEEECAVFGLGITGKVGVTYHVMRRSKNKFLKESHWYMMRTTQTSPGKPQVEEGIEKVAWVSMDKLPKKLKKSWPSIREILKESGLLDA